MNALTAVADSDTGSYAAVVTCDANGNISQVEESEGFSDIQYGKSKLYTYFEYDSLNRLAEHKTKAWNTAQGDWRWTRRMHEYDAVGRLVWSGYQQWWDQGSPGTADSLEHIYAGSQHIQNYDGASTYGARWHWAGAEHNHAAPLRSPNPDTASQNGYNVSNGYAPQRRTYLNPTTEGNQRQLFGQGRPEAKSSSGSGANWYLGTQSQPQGGTQATVESRLFFQGTVTATDMSRATDSREMGRTGFLGSSNSFQGSSGRVVAESIGRDLNPLGRGDGMAYLGGQIRSGWLSPQLAGNMALSGTGTTVNNPGAPIIGGGGTSKCPISSECPRCPVCCLGAWARYSPPNSVPVPLLCDVGCTNEEWASQSSNCHYRMCKGIACGCCEEFSKLEAVSGGDNCVLYKQCGCEKYGGCEPSRWSGGKCVPGRITGGGGGIGGGGGTAGGGAPGCPGCMDGGSNSNGGGTSIGKQPSGSKYACRAIVAGLNGFLNSFCDDHPGELPAFILCCIDNLSEENRWFLEEGVRRLCNGPKVFACVSRTSRYPYDKPSGSCIPGTCAECCYERPEIGSGREQRNVGGCTPKPLGSCPPMICCENIASGAKKYPWVSQTFSFDCLIISTYLHELIHYGGKEPHDNPYDLWDGWKNFMECVCNRYMSVMS